MPRRMEVDRQAAVQRIAEQWSGRTVIHPKHGVFTIPDVTPDSVTMQLIRLSVDILADHVERVPLDEKAKQT